MNVLYTYVCGRINHDGPLIQVTCQGVAVLQVHVGFRQVARLDFRAQLGGEDVAEVRFSVV